MDITGTAYNSEHAQRGIKYTTSQTLSNFSVIVSNTTFLLSWGAPFSLNVTDSPDIFYYTLCTNITIYGCRTIPSDLDCHFPRTCTTSVVFTDPSQMKDKTKM